jgi:hypothetical protein
LLLALGGGGRSDVIFDLTAQTTAPSYGDQLQKGVTTLTEAWDGDPRSSQNHCMLGHAEEWFYSGLGGINPEASGVGFREMTLRPAVVGDVAWVRCSHQSLRGTILSAWRRSGGALTLEVTIPANTVATVHVPTEEPAGVRENGRPAAEAQGVKFLRGERHAAVYRIGSGTYRFSAAAPEPR